MLRAYFDTNVYSGLERDSAPTDVLALQQAIRDGRLLAHVSVVNVLELLGQAEKDRPEMVRQLQRARELVGFHRGILKDATDVLPEAFLAYATGTEPPCVLLAEDDRRRFVRGLGDIMAGSSRFDDWLTALVIESNATKDGWLAEMRKDQDASLARITAEHLEDRDAPSFEAFLRGPAVEHVLELFAERFGCAEGCRRRGLSGLLQVRVVQLGIGVVLSQIHTQLVRRSGNRRRPERSDIYDSWHATLAATVDVFLTFDGRLAEHLERIPDIDGFAVVRSVPELLELLQTAARSR